MGGGCPRDVLDMVHELLVLCIYRLLCGISLLAQIPEAKSLNLNQGSQARQDKSNLWGVEGEIRKNCVNINLSNVFDGQSLEESEKKGIRERGIQ